MKGWEGGKEKEKVTSSSAGLVREGVTGREELPKHFLKGNWKAGNSQDYLASTKQFTCQKDNL